MKKKCVLYQGAECSVLKVGKRAVIYFPDGLEVETGPITRISTDNAACAAFETDDARFMVLCSNSHAATAFMAA